MKPPFPAIHKAANQRASDLQFEVQEAATRTTALLDDIEALLEAPQRPQEGFSRS